MKRTSQALIVLSLLTLASPSPAADDKSKGARKAQLVARGEYLVSSSGCHDCHTPKTLTPRGPVVDLARMLSGSPAEPRLPAPPKLAPGPWNVVASGDLTAWSGPWGTTFARNLTPDAETGIGAWTEQQFLATIRTGKRMGVGRPLLPPMPTEVLDKLTDDDLKAIFAYLQSVPAIRNLVREPEPPAQPAAAAAVASTPAGATGKR